MNVKINQFCVDHVK